MDTNDGDVEMDHPPDVGVSSTGLADAWAEEVTRRIAESDAGVPAVPAEEVWRKIDARRESRHTDR